MPSCSKKQKKFMSAAAHSKKFAKKAGISQEVAKEFHMADMAKGILPKVKKNVKPKRGKYKPRKK